jgi:hypothetical protein
MNESTILQQVRSYRSFLEKNELIDTVHLNKNTTTLLLSSLASLESEERTTQ